LVLFLRWCAEGLAGKPSPISLSLRQCEIAQFLAITPQYLSSLLNTLQARGLIQRDRRGVILLDNEASAAASA
jgi:CRP-like cAMP-binding protein